MSTGVILPMADGVDSDVVRLDGSCGLGRTALGGKAHSVNAMRALGLRVPPAVALTTGCCAEFYAAGGVLPESIWERVRRGIGFLEAETGRRFGADDRPLLVSVRSGAPVSMPGMMDTVLNLGLTEASAAGLAAATGAAAYARDTVARSEAQYRRHGIAEARERLRGDPAGDDVLALGAGQPLTEGSGIAGVRVAGEQHSGAGAVVEVAEDHRLDGDGGAEIGVDPA